jgi:6-pyruvoyltetrahydropterin/6-carboxytetrahydropterin synthase
VFELSIETEFCAAHALVISGQRESVHGHNWRVTVTVAGSALDRDGLLVDFHALEAMVAEIIGPFKNADLNATPQFRGVNPTAEHVAQYIADAIAPKLGGVTPACAARVHAVRVTEAPGCSVVYRPQLTDESGR